MASPTAGQRSPQRGPFRVREGTWRDARGSLCGRGGGRETDRQADRQAAGSPPADLGLQAHAPDSPPTRESSRCGAQCQRPGKRSSGSARPRPLPILGASASLLPCFLASPAEYSPPPFGFFLTKKTGDGLPGPLRPSRGCTFSVWGRAESEPRPPGPLRARSEGQAARLGGEETPSPGGARSRRPESLPSAALPEPNSFSLSLSLSTWSLKRCTGQWPLPSVMSWRLDSETPSSRERASPLSKTSL